MKASFHYPMMGSGRSRQGRSDKIGIVVGEWTLDIPETTKEDTPVALYVCPHEKPTYPVCWYDGAHYRPFQTSEGIIQQADGSLRIKGLTRRLETLLGNRMQEEITFLKRPRQSYYPDGISSPDVAHDLQGGKADLGENWTRPDGHFVFDEDGMVEAARWRALAEEAAGCFLMVDGKLWEKCDEPIYRIAARASPGVDLLGGGPLAGMIRKPILSNTESYVRLFNALEYEMALDAKALTEKYRKPGCKEQSGFIEVFVPQAVRYQSAEGELRRLARLLVQDLEHEMRQGSQSGAANWSDVLSVSKIAAWNEVRMAENCFDFPGGPERLEEAVVALVDILKPFDYRMRVLRDEDVEALLSRWQDREIAVDSIPFMASRL
ncbi:hypothetical protein [Rhizobium sp. BK176]|uniref:hypothetical protein n=1 Tax=Rhizobium sp. BK176 TaxID=2587071 RepID=UPI002168E11E|nr:hypothetical protein [Rhizobium sp. BK176]MCS4089401.1 hypothetical protein [Rhizobium sp. BK176]